ncbi:MAG: DUF6261 family protein [Bacteroidota bacterium]|nr:DUF6261 family protein [Bacteroidota bacterium]
MKIKNLHLSCLRNNEHFQFQTGFKELIELLTAAMLKIEESFTDFLLVYIKENEILEEINQSNISDDLFDADNNRDITFRGMLEVIKSAATHFRPEVRQASARLQAFFNLYANLSVKSFDDQTAAIDKFVEDLVGKYAVDVATVGLAEWVSELKIKNLTFDSLKKSRYSEKASQLQLLIKQVRTEVDAAYQAITDRVNALIEVEGEVRYMQFMLEMNRRIDAFEEILAQRKAKEKKLTPHPAPPEDYKFSQGLQA